MTRVKEGPAMDQAAESRLTVALVGEVGAGKSHLCRRLRQWLRTEKEWAGYTVVDTAGLQAGVAPSPAERLAQAEALRRCAEAAVVLHVLDASRERLFLQPGADLSSVDQALVRWGRVRGGYVAVAAKMDRPGARVGLLTLARHLADLPLVPVSSLCGTGWTELRVHLRAVVGGR
jgi:predicted GTPase